MDRVQVRAKATYAVEVLAGVRSEEDRGPSGDQSSLSPGAIEGGVRRRSPLPFALTM